MELVERIDGTRGIVVGLWIIFYTILDNLFPIFWCPISGTGFWINKGRWLLWYTCTVVTGISRLRILVATAYIFNLTLKQMNVQTNFLNGGLNEEIYMEQLRDLSYLSWECEGCRFTKSLYCLKKPPKSGKVYLINIIISHGFWVNEVDKCIYYMLSHERGIIICFYVDDMLIFNNDCTIVLEIWNYFHHAVT